MSSGPFASDLDRPLFYTTLSSNVLGICQAGKIPSPADSPAEFAGPWCPHITASRAYFAVPVSKDKTLKHFVALTGTSRTPAAFNIATGRRVEKVLNQQLALFITTAQALLDNSVELTIATAQPLSAAATFIEGREGVSAMDWPLITSKSFAYDPSDASKGSRVGAEVLAYPAVPLAAIHRVVVWSDEQEIKALISNFPGCAHIDVSSERQLFFPHGAFA